MKSQEGITDYVIDDEQQFIYFGYYGYGEDFNPVDEPQDVTFFDACPSEANKLELREVYVDTGAEYLDADNSIILGNKGDNMSL